MVVGTQSTQAVRENKKAVSVRRAGLAAWICLLIVYVVWGSTYLAIRVGVETMPPLLMAAARSLVAGLLVGLAGVALLVLAAVTGEFGSLHLGHVSARYAGDRPPSEPDY